MGLFSAFTGNAAEVSGERMEKLIGELLAPGERIEKGFQLVRDAIVFTDKRMILVDRQGVTGSKAEVLSIPYSKVTKFARESAGLFDIDAELKIWVGSDPEPVRQQFSRTVNINEVYAILSAHVLG
jgi:hypothetical protein